ncbi:Uncharacterised protein [Vibrio cholerae]|nr:Uncharacterised protein [Vibrio cholerae]CSD14245.1 Uncharacterised protein [Vibrio cholerae]CSD30604.1 Uncharacterised protein [Vibrio cholerae]
MLHRGVFTQVHRKSGFTHRRTRCDDDQIRALQTSRLFIQVGKARVHSSDPILRRFVEQLNPL